MHCRYHVYIYIYIMYIKCTFWLWGKWRYLAKARSISRPKNSHVRFFDLEPYQLLGNLSVIADCSAEIISAIFGIFVVLESKQV